MKPHANASTIAAAVAVCCPLHCVVALAFRVPNRLSISANVFRTRENRENNAADVVSTGFWYGLGANSAAAKGLRAFLSDGETATDGVGDERDMKSLKQWSAARGVRLADGFDLEPSGGGDWGMSLRRSAEAGTVVLRVPKSVVLSSEDDLGMDVSAARAVLGSCDMDEHWPEFLLVVRILVERAKGRASDWFPWLQSLPVTFTTGLFMDDAERSHLPTLARGLVRLQDRQLEVFAEAVRSLSDYSLSQLLSRNNAYDLVRWVFSIVFTRSHRYSMDGDVRTEIVPLGDLFNHRDPGDVRWRETPDDIEFVLKENVVVAPGESRALYLSYGLPNPHRFLTIFGFVDEHVPEVLSQVIFTQPTPEMVALGCNDPTKMVFRAGDGMIANAVWDSMLYAILKPKPEEQEALYDAHMEGDREAKAVIHSRYALEVSLALRNHVEQTLAESFSEATEDTPLDQAKHPTLQLINKHNLLMRGIFSKVKHRLDGIVDVELRRRMAQQQAEQEENV